MFRAQTPEGDRVVAVKLFRLDLPPERVQQLVAELQRLIDARLTHPGIAAPLATGIEGHAAYLVQEFAAADSLDIVVRDHGPAPPDEALRVAGQLAGALDFAATVNIDHGVLHPRDILISANEMRITGLGVARALERVGVTPPVRRPYTAPERIGGAGWDRRADIFSLAALLHEMLWGRRVAGAGRQAVEALTELPGADLAALGRVFSRALADNPADRFGTALELADALRSAFSTQPGAAAGPIASSRSAAADPRQPTLDLILAEPEIRPAEPVRFRDVEPAPAAVPLALDPPLEHEPVFRPPPAVTVPIAPRITSPPSGFLSGYDTEPVSVLERSRSAMWPLALALIVGVALALGFGAGYAVGSRDRVVTTVAAGPGGSPSPSAPPGREFTEGAVGESPKPTAAPTPAPPAVAQAPAVEPTPSPAPGRTAVADAGRLLVKSTPSGARVFVDGRDHGRTPATIRDLGRGSHRVRLVQEGYATEERRVAINPTHPLQSVIVAMTRTRAPTAPPPAASLFGSLTVESRPAGAKVFIDGQPAGATPLTLPRLGTGDHEVRLEHEGYRRWSSSVKIVSGERNRVTASLEK